MKSTLRCLHCGSTSVQKRGKNKKRKLKIKCSDCEKYSLIEEKITPKIGLGAKILLFDIETAPMEVYVWQLKYNNYISHENIIKDFSVLCWSAKWLFDPEMIAERVTGQMAMDRQDDLILKHMWELLDQADIVVVQNGKKFDIPKLNARFLKAGYPPPMYYQVVDTKEIMAKNFGLSSNRLDYATQFLGIRGKDDMVFDDWIQCVRGSEQHLQKMLDYNKDDVLIMEELYLKLRPWIPAHSNLGLFADTDKDCCPSCQSTELRWSGQYSTPLGLYEGFRCLSCGAIGRSTKKKYRIKGVEVRG